MALYRLLDRLLGGLIILIVTAMMLLTFADVVGRELFSRPLLIAPEMTTIALAATVYIGLPLVSARDEHITISLFEGLF